VLSVLFCFRTLWRWVPTFWRNTAPSYSGFNHKDKGFVLIKWEAEWTQNMGVLQTRRMSTQTGNESLPSIPYVFTSATVLFPLICILKVQTEIYSELSCLFQYSLWIEWLVLKYKPVWSMLFCTGYNKQYFWEYILPFGPECFVFPFSLQRIKIETKRTGKILKQIRLV
jgi:hypothetical protein